MRYGTKWIGKACVVLATSWNLAEQVRAAEQVVGTVVADTWITFESDADSRADENHGADPRLRIRSGNGDLTNAVRKGLIRFDVSGQTIDPNLVYFLELTTHNDGSSSSVHTINAITDAVLQAFDENTLTWNLAPASAQAEVANFNSAGPAIAAFAAPDLSQAPIVSLVSGSDLQGAVFSANGSSFLTVGIGGSNNSTLDLQTKESDLFPPSPARLLTFDVIDSVANGLLTSGSTWAGGAAPTAANFYRIVNGNEITDSGASFAGEGVLVENGTLTFAASSVSLPLIIVSPTGNLSSSPAGDFFLGDINASPLQSLVLNASVTLDADSGSDIFVDMQLTGDGELNINGNGAGSDVFLSFTNLFEGRVRFNGTGDEVVFSEVVGGVGGFLEMNSTGANRLVYDGADTAGGGTVLFNLPGQIDHRSDSDRLHGAAVVQVNADLTVDLTKTYSGNERRMFISNSLEGAASVTVQGTAADPSFGTTTLNEFEVENTDENSSDGLHLAGFSGELTANDFVNLELRREFLDAAFVINQNARLEMGFRDIDAAFSLRLADVTINTGGALEVGYEADDMHVPLELRLSNEGSRSGNLTLAGGATTIMQISGTGEHDYDRIVVDGTASLDGTLQVLVNPEVPEQTDTITDGPYLPTLGDTFDIISVGAGATAATDFDQDGSVDGEDYRIWQANFGTSGGATMNEGDANGDGAVSGLDFLSWQAGFGSFGGGSGIIEGAFDNLEVVDPDGALAGAGLRLQLIVSDSLVQLEVVAAGFAGAVPEPSTAVLALALAMALGGLRRSERTGQVGLTASRT